MPIVGRDGTAVKGWNWVDGDMENAERDAPTRDPQIVVKIWESLVRADNLRLFSSLFYHQVEK